MSDIGEQFSVNGVDDELLSGSVKEWYDSVIDASFECNRCEYKFNITDENIGMHSNQESVNIVDKIRTKISGENPHNYDIPDYSIETALFTEDGMPVTALIQCPDCTNIHGHNDEYVRDEYPIPDSKWEK